MNGWIAAVTLQYEVKQSLGSEVIERAVFVGHKIVMIDKLCELSVAFESCIDMIKHELIERLIVTGKFEDALVFIN